MILLSDLLYMQFQLLSTHTPTTTPNLPPPSPGDRSKQLPIFPMEAADTTERSWMKFSPIFADQLCPLKREGDSPAHPSDIHTATNRTPRELT
ncbi:hypothetical protein BaRGS_00022281 [Batillaria attramentaria]|uniref:Uncharacterized protein n=1 Tax=Batillaria attramentaria TaxID=370345 RepID=A0ABD0KH14_9CAEN